MKSKYGFIALAILILAIPALMPWSVSPDIRSKITAQLQSSFGLNLSASDDVTLHLLPTIRIDLRDVSIADAHGLKIQTPHLTAGIDVPSLILGELRISSLNFDTSTININLDQEVKDEQAYQQSQNTASPPIISRTDLGSLNISNSTVHVTSTAQDIDTDLQHVSLRIIWPQLNSPLALEGQVQWQDKKLNFAAWIGNPLALMKHAASPLSFKINSDSAQLKSSGQIYAGPRIQYEGHTDARYISVRDLAYLAGTEIPSSFQSDITALSAVTFITPHALILSELRADYGQHKIEGSLSVQKKDHQRPTFSATLASDEFEVAPTPQQSSSTPHSETGTSDQHVKSLYDIIGADLDMRISIGRLHIGDNLLREAGISILLKNGHLDAALVEARLHRGTIRGRLELTPQDDGFSSSLTTNWTKVEVSTLLSDLLKTSMLTGQSDGTIDVTTRGGSIAQSLINLQGKVNISIANGDINGFDIEQALRRLDRNPLTIMSNIRSGRTGFDLLQLNAQINDGQAILDQSTLSGPAVQFDVTGALNITTQTMDIAINARQNNAAHSDGPQLNMRLNGPWAKPKLSIDPKSLLNSSDTP